MAPRGELAALREGVVVVRDAGLQAFRVTGDGAHALVDGRSSRPVLLRDGQVLPTLFLHEDGRVRADAWICADDLDYLVLADAEEPLGDWLAGADAEVEPLGGSHVLLGVHGPYAWELLADLVGAEVIGVPYLSSFHHLGWEATVLRAGRTGEFGYELLVPRARAEEAWAALLALGQGYDAVVAGRDTLDEAALENGFYHPRLPGVAGLDAATLGQLWRVTPGHPAPGVAAVPLRPARRLAWLWLDAEAEPGGRVRMGGAEVGTLLYARRSPVLERVVGLAVLDAARAWPGLPVEAPVTGRTTSPPLLHNRSLFIDPQRHSWLGRGRDVFPPVVGV